MSEEWTPYVVQQGDHTRKLAFRAGATPDEVWAHPKNAELATLRPNMDTLNPGDVIHLPVKPAPGLALQGGASNRYQAVVPTVPFRAVLESSSRSLANQPYELHGLGGAEPLKGVTTGGAEVVHDLPAWVREVEVRLVDLGMRFGFDIGGLDPVTETSGVAQRLVNLGHLPSDAVNDPARRAAALSAFQRSEGLEPTGDLDDATRAALERAHVS